MGNFGKIELGVKPENCDRFVGNSEDRCSNTTEYRATMDQGGIEPLTDPDRPYCSCLVGHGLGRREICPKKYHFKIGFSQKRSKISTSEHEAQEAQTEFVFAQTKFVFANFPKMWQIFGEIGLRKLHARALCKARS